MSQVLISVQTALIAILKLQINHPVQKEASATVFSMTALDCASAVKVSCPDFHMIEHFV